MKKTLWNKKELSEALSCSLQDKHFTDITGVSFDSRTIQKGDMFFAFTGKKLDGNNFINLAIKKGASLCFSDNIKNVNSLNIPKVIQVKSTYDTANTLAKYRRKTLCGKVIAITGSLGKTSTKEMLKFAFSSAKKVFANRKNFNNYYGVPMSLIECPKDVDFCILELGMSKKGEITHLVNIVEPNIAIITNVYPVHLEFFQSIEKIAYAKSEIFNNISRTKFVILNSESNYIKLQQNEAKKKHLKVFTFGKDNSSDCYIKETTICDKFKYLKIKCFGKYFQQKFQYIVGDHLVYNTLSLFILVYKLKLRPDLIINSLEKFRPLPGRGEVIKLKKNYDNR